jgi:hypothetical protein
MSSWTGSAEPTPKKRKSFRLLEGLAVVMLAAATVGSAWCAYQASQWNGEESRLTAVASDERTDAARLFGLATQRVSYDATSVAFYAQARVAGDERLTQFYRSALISERFLPVLERWEDAVDAGQTPPRLTEEEEYMTDQFAEYYLAIDSAEAATTAASAAGDHAEDFILGTLLLAIALFFAGVTTSFSTRGVRFILLAGAAASIAYAGVHLSDLPVL